MDESKFMDGGTQFMFASSETDSKGIDRLQYRNVEKSGTVVVIREESDASDGLDSTEYIKFKAPSSGYVVFTANNIPKNVGDHLRLDLFYVMQSEKKSAILIIISLY